MTLIYVGIYICGREVNRGLPGVPNSAITLTTGGKLMIHILT